ncbi:putative peroxiredoxin [Sinorhizobium terangae]|nr:putative peroxiredoxin [Sinorhizobium terangae]
MFQGFDIVICETAGQLVAPVEWKDLVKRVEFVGAAEDGLAVGTR